MTYTSTTDQNGDCNSATALTCTRTSTAKKDLFMTSNVGTLEFSADLGAGKLDALLNGMIRDVLGLGKGRKIATLLNRNNIIGVKYVSGTNNDARFAADLSEKILF